MCVLCRCATETPPSPPLIPSTPPQTLGFSYPPPVLPYRATPTRPSSLDPPPPHLSSPPIATSPLSPHKLHLYLLNHLLRILPPFPPFPQLVSRPNKPGEPPTYLLMTHRTGQVDFKVNPCKKLEDGIWEFCESIADPETTGECSDLDKGVVWCWVCPDSFLHCLSLQDPHATIQAPLFFFRWPSISSPNFSLPAPPTPFSPSTRACPAPLPQATSAWRSMAPPWTCMPPPPRSG